MELFKNSKNPILIISRKKNEEEIRKWMDHREQIIALHLGRYLCGVEHRPFGPEIQKVLDDFHIKEAVDEYNRKKIKKK